MQALEQVAAPPQLRVQPEEELSVQGVVRQQGQGQEERQEEERVERKMEGRQE